MVTRSDTYVHIHLAREQRLARRVQKHDALDQIQRAHDQHVVLPIATLGQQSVERVDQAQGHVPLEALLQLEEFAKGGVVGEFLEALGRRRHAVVGRVVAAGLG